MAEVTKHLVRFSDTRLPVIVDLFSRCKLCKQTYHTYEPIVVHWKHSAVAKQRCGTNTKRSSTAGDNTRKRLHSFLNESMRNKRESKYNLWFLYWANDCSAGFTSSGRIENFLLPIKYSVFLSTLYDRTTRLFVWLSINFGASVCSISNGKLILLP